MVFPLVGALINGATATLNVASGTFGAWAALHSDQHQAEIAQDIQGHSVRLQRSMALREDIRDLRKLEVETVLTSMTVGSIMLGCCFAVFTEGYPPPDAISAWADIWMFNIAWSICLTFLSIWLASVYQVCVSKFARALLLEEYRIYLPSENEIRNAGGLSLWDRVKALQAVPIDGSEAVGSAPDTRGGAGGDATGRIVDTKEFYAETQININEHFKEQINRYIPLKEFSDKYLRAGGTALIAAVVCTLGSRLDTSEWFRADVFMLCVFAAPLLFSVTATAFYHARETDSTRPSFGDFVTLTKERSKRHFRSAGGLLKAPFGSCAKRDQKKAKKALLVTKEEEKASQPPSAGSTRAPFSGRTLQVAEDLSKSSLESVCEARDGTAYTADLAAECNGALVQSTAGNSKRHDVPVDRDLGGVFEGFRQRQDHHVKDCDSIFDDDSSVVHPRAGCLPLDNCAASVPPMTSRRRNVAMEEKQMQDYPPAMFANPSVADVEEGRVSIAPRDASSLTDGASCDGERRGSPYPRLQSQATGVSAILVPTETPCSEDSQRVRYTMRHFHRILWMLVIATFIATLVHIILEAVNDSEPDVAKLQTIPISFPPFFESVASVFVGADTLYVLSTYRLLQIEWDGATNELMVKKVDQLQNETATLFVNDDQLHLVQKGNRQIRRLSNSSIVSEAPISSATSLALIGDRAFLASDASSQVRVYEFSPDQGATRFGQLMYTIGHPCTVIGLADASVSIDSPRLIVLLDCETLLLWDISSGARVKQWKLDTRYKFTSVAFSRPNGALIITGVEDSTQKVFQLSV
ncbi:hypothetical protein FOZ60_000493 [Perkinsus olseni]|uniref:Uncharacterized protein n=2 Tax=Perkinsus olseni TaxID=32597 RepID=A0A7J6P3A5_PEROL|nr:hypothetical protein FOZ60_000493 [Perkinsus olseni]